MASVEKDHPITSSEELTLDMPAETQQENVEEQEELLEEQSGSSLASLFRETPSWLVSSIIHAVIILLLFSLTFSLPEKKEMHMIGGTENSEFEELEQFEISNSDQLQELQEVEIPNPVAALEVNDLVSTADLGLDASAQIGQLTMDEGITGEISGLFGASDLGMSKMGGGSGKATFFGVETTGNRFVYVVDNSNSMNNGKFETALYEIIQSVAKLGPEHEFYVIFYSDTYYPLFYPKTERYPVPATPENKEKLAKWFGTVHRCLHTRGEEALDLAMRMRPDGLYLLGDGAFTDKAIPKAMALAEGNNITMHTLGFGMKEQHAKQFDALSKAFNGTFQNVQVTPQMVAFSKQVKRPANRETNGDWGKFIKKKKK